MVFICGYRGRLVLCHIELVPIQRVLDPTTISLRVVRLEYFSFPCTLSFSSPASWRYLAYGPRLLVPWSSDQAAGLSALGRETLMARLAPSMILSILKW